MQQRTWRSRWSLALALSSADVPTEQQRGGARSRVSEGSRRVSSRLLLLLMVIEQSRSRHRGSDWPVQAGEEDGQWGMSKDR